MASLCAQTGHFYIINRHAKFITVFNSKKCSVFYTQTEQFLGTLASFM